VRPHRTPSLIIAITLILALVGSKSSFAQPGVGDLNQTYVPPTAPVTTIPTPQNPVQGQNQAQNLTMAPTNSGAGSMMAMTFAAMCLQAFGGGLSSSSPASLRSTAAWGDDLEAAARAPFESPHRSPASVGSGTVVGIDCNKTGQANANITLGYNSDERCTRERMHQGMAEHMNQHFLGCVQAAAEAAGMEKPEKIHINHMGCHVVRTVRGSSTMSLHSHGRALDIGAIIFKPSGRRVSMHVREARGPNRDFYNSLRACWARSLPAACRNGSGREAFGSIGYPGSQGPGNNDHNDHLHLSFPPCAGG
jgi:hypothetical protein